MTQRPTVSFSTTSILVLFLNLLLVTVEAKVKVWGFVASHGKAPGGVSFDELVATLAECDFPNVPRSCVYLGQQRIENSPVPRAYSFSVAGCAAAVDFGSIYSCNPVSHVGTPGSDSTCQSFFYSGNWYYGTYKLSGAKIGGFFSASASVDQIMAVGC
jgi:hypothetical protein